MTLNEAYDYLKMNGLPVTMHEDDTEILLEGSTLALRNRVFIAVYKRSDSSCCVPGYPYVWLAEATYRDLDKLIDSYLEHCDLDRAKSIRLSRLRYAIDLHQRAKP